MRNFLVIVCCLISVSVEARTLRINLRGELQRGESKPLVIFQDQLLLADSESSEIFTGPYTLRLTSDDDYAIAVEAFGLGPQYHESRYVIKLAIGDSLAIPSLPVKGDVNVTYTVTLIDDISGVISAEPPDSDTTAWGISESIHYKTHWLKGSYADYNWNIRMGYNEIIYDKYRYSFSLSSSDKFDFYFHPDRQTSAYINPGLGYSINPRIRRIDAIFGQDEVTATPRPGAELVLYRLWGYAPRWMVTGFAGYYFDHLLQMRALSHEFKAEKLAAKFSDVTWIDSDTGQIVTGAFCRYLVDTYPISKFMELFRNATDIDFREQFEKTYKQKFNEAVKAFLTYAGEYEPQKGEIDFFGSLYMQQGEYEKAKDYLTEVYETTQDIRERKSARRTLALCDFWLGNYQQASNTLLAINIENCCDEGILQKNLKLARDAWKEFPRWLFEEDDPCPDCYEGNLIEAASYLDIGNIEAAEKLFSEIENKIKISPEYLIELGRLQIMRGEWADSILFPAASMVLNRISGQPYDPTNYFLAGQAFLLLGDYDSASENLNTALFLERRPYFWGAILLELGKLSDIQGNREEACNFYNEVVAANSGGYQKFLANKYLAKQFTLEPTGN